MNKKIFFIILIFFIISCDDKTNSSKDLCEDIDCGGEKIGECLVVAEKASCHCYSGYHLEDLTCIKDIIEDPCNSNPCTELHKTVCEADNNSYSCLCDKDYILKDDSCVEREKEKLKIRVLSANLTTGIYQDYQEYGMRIIKGLKPDIVMIQEFNYDLDEDNTTSKDEINLFLKETLGSEFYYYRGEEITVEDGDIPIPNGVISRFPIIAKGEWGDNKVVNRNFTWVKLDIPGDKDLWVISLHLKAGSSDAGTRDGETKALMTDIRSNIPDDAYIIIGGDLNTNNRDENAIDNLSTLFKTSAPHPIGEAGKEGTNASRRNPYDWVILSKSLASFQISSDFCDSDNSNDCMRYENGLVFDSKKYEEFDLNLYFSPIKYNDSRADSMQHMGVVKDFELEY